MAEPVPSHPLPMQPDEALSWWGWDTIDILLVTGDAYVDHPSFGAALIGRTLVADGWRVGICAQPQAPDDLLRLGRPRLWIGITAGNLDSMLNRYTAARKLRSDDHYSPGGRAGLRPDRASLVYAGWARQAHKGVPVVLGGIEASLRRFAHFDYWSDSVRRSVLADAKADLLAYGMAESQVRAISRRLAAGEPAEGLCDLPGTCVPVRRGDALPPDAVRLPGFDAVSRDPAAFAEAAAAILAEQDPLRGRPLVQDQGWCLVVQHPPALPLATAELDTVYGLPFTRAPHPSYREAVPALATVRNSIQTHRGCSGSCAFCALGAHQGRMIASRSPASVAAEARHIAAQPGFNGTIDDVGGPTANLYGATCSRWGQAGTCRDRDCLWPEPCPNLKTDPQGHLALLDAVATTPGVRHAFIQSGLRHDLLLLDGPAYLGGLLARHICGRLKVAPEAADDAVLAAMRKPAWAVYRAFLDLHDRCCHDLGREVPVVPYLMAAHPGATLAGAAEAAARLRQTGQWTDLVQEFIPTPMTLATAMYLSGRDPQRDQRLEIPRGDRQRRLHKALLHADRSENRALALVALAQAGRNDLAASLFGQPDHPPARHEGRAKPPTKGSHHGNPRRSGRRGR